MILLAIYLAALLRLTVFRSGCFSHGLFSGRVVWLPGVSYRNLIGWGSYSRAAYLFFGNLLGFAPWGYFLARRGGGFWDCLLQGLLLSLMIEAGQYALGSGLSETDDLILNSLGALLGFGIYHLSLRIVIPCER